MLEITQLVRSLDLPDNGYIVIGGGLLTALELRELHDIDILTSPEVFERFKQSGGWQQVEWIGQAGLRREPFEIGTQVRGFGVDDLLDYRYFIEDVPYLIPELVFTIKQLLRRPRDIRDMQLMQPLRDDFCRDCLHESQQIMRRMFPLTDAQFDQVIKSC